VDFPGPVSPRSFGLGNDNRGACKDRDGARTVDRISRLPDFISFCLAANFEARGAEKSEADCAITVSGLP